MAQPALSSCDAVSPFTFISPIRESRTDLYEGGELGLAMIAAKQRTLALLKAHPWSSTPASR